MQLYKFLFNVFLISTLFLCKGVEKKKEVQVEKVDPYYNELALFISGSTKENGMFADLSKTKEYVSYAKQTELYWKAIEKENSRIRIWSKEKVPAYNKDNTVLYLLSGADIINAYNFYPDARRYVFIGLEPTGKILNPLTLDKKQWKKGLNSMQDLLYEFSLNNYFTYRRMRRELANPYFQGVTPLMVIFLSRLGMQIEKWETLEIQDDGKLSLSTEDKKEGMYGSRIIFRDSKGEKRELSFFRIMINENSFSMDQKEGKFFNSLGRLNLIFKSAEYLLQEKRFERFIKGLLEKSDMVVQDDSAIAYTAFNQTEWDVHLFGKYTSRVYLRGTPPVGSQKELIELYKSKSEVLPFNYGYGVIKGRTKSSLMVFKRK
ncbi:MAG: hypothetical protein H7A25_07780 [Leptospiraceae bacterium]|nr:hypothetical protein [Leptospiraceae bacterium]MCP5499784.1 hypothetical protein [Leptospiraceae bacterium]